MRAATARAMAAHSEWPSLTLDAAAADAGWPWCLGCRLAKQTIPHTYLSHDCTVDRLEALLNVQPPPTASTPTSSCVAIPLVPHATDSQPASPRPLELGSSLVRQGCRHCFVHHLVVVVVVGSVASNTARHLGQYGEGLECASEGAAGHRFTPRLTTPSRRCCACAVTHVRTATTS